MVGMRSDTNLKVFKLGPSGSFDELSTEKLITQFSLFDVLAFFSLKQKRMYIWIEKKASPAIKSHIPEIRELFTNSYPDLRILRTFTIESGNEPSEFLTLIGITESEIEDHLNELDTRVLPAMAEINRLKTKASKQFVSENFESAISLSKKVIDIAKEIDDESLEMNEEIFVNEAELQLQRKKQVKDIEEEAKKLTEVFNDLVKLENFEAAHEVVDEFKRNHSRFPGFNEIPKVHKLLLKDENLIHNLILTKEKLKSQLFDLDKEIGGLLENNHIEKVKIEIAKIEERKEKFGDDSSMVTNLLEIKGKYQAKTEQIIKQLTDLSKEALQSLVNDDILNAIQLYEDLVSRLEIYCKE